MTYEFVLKSLNNMVDQINIKYVKLEDILQYDKEIKFMELRSDETYNISTKRNPITVYVIFILLSQVVALFMSIFLLSLNKKK